MTRVTSTAVADRIYCVLGVKQPDQDLVLLRLPNDKLFAPLESSDPRQVGETAGLGEGQIAGLIGEAAVGAGTVLSVFLASAPANSDYTPLVLDRRQLYYAAGNMRRYGETPMSLLSKLNTRDPLTNEESRCYLACALVLASKGLIGALL